MLDKLKKKLKNRDTGSVLVIGAGSSFLIKMAGAIIALGVQILLARIMGPEQYGIFAYVISWLIILVLFGKLGLDTSMVRFVAAYKATGEWGLLKGVLRAGNKLTIISSLSVGLLGFIVVWAIGDMIERELRITAWIGCAVLPLMALVQVRQALLRALQHIIKAIMPEFIIQPMLHALIVAIAFFLFAREMRASETMFYHFISFVITLFIISYWLRMIIRSETSDAPEQMKTREWIAVTLPLLMLAGFNLINHRADVIMVGFFMGTTEAGFYSVAVKLANFLVWGLNAVNIVAAPMIADLYAKKDKRELQRMASMAAAGIAAFTIPAAIIMLVFGKNLLGLFGSEFTQAYPALVFLVVGQGMNALVGSVSYLLTMTGYQREAAIVIGITAVINIALNVILIPRLGLQGAAIATAISTIIWKISMYILVRKRLSIEPSFLGLFRKTHSE